MNTENLSTLKIHKLTQAQYDRELAAGNIDQNALYLTPDEGMDLDLEKIMDLTSDQTATGVKTFANGIKIGNATMTYDSINNRIVINVQGSDASNLISFYIGNTQYNGLVDMTWLDWVQSTYNTDGFVNESYFIYSVSGNYVVDNNIVAVEKNDLILKDTQYKLSSTITKPPEDEEE